MTNIVRCRITFSNPVNRLRLFIYIVHIPLLCTASFTKRIFVLCCALFRVVSRQSVTMNPLLVHLFLCLIDVWEQQKLSKYCHHPFCSWCISHQPGRDRKTNVKQQILCIDSNGKINNIKTLQMILVSKLEKVSKLKQITIPTPCHTHNMLCDTR